MRFIHMADVHFDSPFTALASKKDLANIRRLEQREAFKKAIEYINREKIPFLFISGDLYEQEYIRESTIEYINNLFRTIPETKIFISPGNHDPFLNNSFYNNYNWSKNVTIFNEEIKMIELDDVDIYGYGFTSFYCTDSKVDEIEIKNKNKINILITHGALDASKTLDMQYNPINSNKLKKAGFDYVALGHIHKSNYKNNENNFIYPGSLISFGFDELGEHGILDVEINKKNSEKNNLNKLEIKNNIEKNKINNLNKNNNLEKIIIKNSEIKNILEKNKEEKENIQKDNLINCNINEYINKKIFVKLDKRTFKEKEIDISDINSEEELIEKINEIEKMDNEFYKIILRGVRKIEINNSRICKLISNKNVLKLKDKTETEYDIESLANQKNLKGIFIKRMLQKLGNNFEQKDVIKKALEIGLKSFE